MEILEVVISVAVIQVTATLWLKSRLTYSIKHEYDRKLEEYKNEAARREKAALVAELMAEWTHPRESSKRLNQILWELSLYLPSSIIRQLNTCIAKQPGQATVEDIIVIVRDHLLDKADPLSKADIHHFKDPGNTQMEYTQP